MEEKVELKWWHKLLIYIGTGVLVLILGSPSVRRKMSERRRLKEKVKYFKPTITESFWGNRVSWEMRDKPLTKEEIKLL